MKKTIWLFVFGSLAILFACQSDSGVQEIKSGPNADLVRNPVSANMPLDTNQLARISYEAPIYEFGTVKEGEIVEHTFKFTNTGKIPLVIQKARSSCGCTVPEWPQEPIPPGGTGVITAKFNTESKTGLQSKQIRVTANTYPNETKVELKGMVEPVKSQK
ncbi:MAG: DUF1573 domain-containing protein [Saprospiraceae bacterium]|nr:DUF1573 domain-containing protein [Saprospiraceae bacterium]